MLTDQHRIDLFGFFFPAVKDQIAAFRKSFCQEPGPYIATEIHSFHERASMRNLVTPFAGLDFYAPDHGSRQHEDVCEHIILAVDYADALLETFSIGTGYRLRPYDCFRKLDPNDVRYLCSVRRRRLTLPKMNLPSTTLFELSIGVLYRPRKGFRGIVLGVSPTLPPAQP